ncbi:FecR family protein [Pseudanabaena sp. Chao 1811]|uniref:FecR family protein n=1 Tax=Pseudanabaena sp. Chao 1811 TaxID=2963092 RepID=UPI0022F3CC4F|nr:FecR family protein [Pseudanabaena sp. Chao 1811]
MFQNRKKFRAINLAFVTIFGLLLDLSEIALISPDVKKAQAQGGIQVRTDQWLQVEQVSGNVTYRNLYNYTNRAARVGDRLQVASDEISTGANSSAVLSVDTAVGSIYIAENTTLRINSFRVAADNGRITNLIVPRGKARLQIRKFTNRGSQLNIQTPAGISGVRGTQYIVIARSNGNMIVTTLEGRVATTAQKRTEMVNGGFENLTVMGEPPSPAVPIKNDASFSYVINRQASGSGRSILFIGYTNPFNTVKVDGRDQPLDRNGNFSIQFPAPSNLKVNVKVETPQGKVQVYEIPIL